MTRTVTLFFALLALASMATVLVAVVLTALSGAVPAAAELRGRLADEVRGRTLVLAAIVTTVATLGSLYLSEVAGFPPCTLCWVQRGFMYPLALVLWVAAWRGSKGVARYARWWAVAGGAVSTWHIIVERFPSLEQSSGFCAVDNPCSVRWVEHFGFITIPVMALAAFALAALLLSVRPTSDTDTDTDTDPTTRRDVETTT